MIRISSIGRSFISLPAIRAKRRLAVAHSGRSSRLWSGGRGSNRRLLITHRAASIGLQWGNCTLGIYTNRWRESFFPALLFSRPRIYHASKRLALPPIPTPRVWQPKEERFLNRNT